jgi:uncharacterized damage-inducible protein DinB
MTTFFKELFDYNHYCNQGLIAVMTDHAKDLSDRSIKLFSHILSAHHVWNCRIEESQSLYDAIQIHLFQDLKYINRKNYFDTLLILDEFELNKNIEYTTGKGEVFSHSVCDILFHVINHSTYHRGQVAVEFREIGLEPLITDYVFYKMKNNQLLNKIAVSTS